MRFLARMPPGNMQGGHPMMMGQGMGPNSGMPGQHIQQPMAQQAMPPPAAQVIQNRSKCCVESF